MVLTPFETLCMIAAVAAGTMLTRFLPFLLFRESAPPPRVVIYLGRVLPAAMMGLLVVYCLKGTTFLAAPYGIPEAVAVAAILLLHRWKRNTLLSIGAGTALYMFLLQVVVPRIFS